MRTLPAAIATLLVGACGTTPPDEIRVCDTALATSSGSVEIGRGGAGEYTPLAAGDTFQVVLGAQGLWMFLVSARVTGMDIDGGDSAAMWFHAVGPAGEAMSLDFNCSERNFEAADGGIEMKTPFPLALFPDYTSILGGGNVTLQVTVRDRSGNEATSELTVVAQLPP